MNAPDDETIIEHTRRWLEKAVIGLNLCPFAKAPYTKGLVRISVSHARHLDGFLEDLDRELQLLGSTPADELETTLLCTRLCLAIFCCLTMCWMWPMRR